jgi:4-hydroxy-2,2'-bipyrrole-5-carbaldehyde O-methyltransferase
MRLITQNKLKPLLYLSQKFHPFYKLTFAHSAASNGLLDILSGRPMPLEKILEHYAPLSKNKEILKAWLQLGVRLNEIKANKKGYCLKGLSKKLASSKNDEYSALTQEVVGIHHKILVQAPKFIKNNQKWNFGDHDGKLVARSSRTLEPFIFEAIERTFPPSGANRLLEVGCGSAAYMKFAVRMNPDLTAVGLELQKDVAEMAAENISSWKLSDQISIECNDIRDYSDENGFDIVSLHNNIYYFSVSERISLFKHIKKLLNKGGFILLTTSCQHGSPLMEMLNLWCVSTDGYDRLPIVDEMKKQLFEAGFVKIKAIKLIPGDQYYAFIGYQS